MEASRRHIFSGAIVEELAGFSRAVVVGDMIFVSGTVGVDAETGLCGPTARVQAEQALDAIAAALIEADSGLQDIVRVRVYLSDLSHDEDVAVVLKQRIGMYYPANTTVCATLTTPDALVEIEVEAIRDSGTPIV